ncbi:hypothetical protein LDI10_02115 [Lactobacillus delbrueckii subsp. indicus]|nr:hypothetical protein LDI10_02115 [Lactobacillus delbrueckii subsp. indicus]
MSITTPFFFFQTGEGIRDPFWSPWLRNVFKGQGQSITHASIKRPAMIMKAVGNIVDELMSAKKQALAAAFASM